MASSSPETDSSPSPPSPPSPSSDSDSALPNSPSSSPPAAPPPLEGSQSPPQSSLPSSPPPSSPPPSSPPPSSPPPQNESPPSSSPPSPPTDSQPPPDNSSSSPPPSPPAPSNPPPSNNSSSPTTPSPPASASPTSPSSNSSQTTPVFSPPPPARRDNSAGRTPPAPVGGLSPPPSALHPAAPAPPQGSEGALGPTTSPSPLSSNSASGDKSPLVIGVVAGVVLILALVVVWLLCSKKRKKKQSYYADPGRPPKGGDPYWNGAQPNDHVVKLHPPPAAGGWGAPPAANTSSDFGSAYSGQHHPGFGPPSPQVGGMMGGFNKSQFTYEELAAATGGFSQANLLGQGGFGYVHKGVLPDGRLVAVKSLKSGSGQGEREFQAEVEIISRVHHRHLVSLVGYCISERQRMLVYEYVPNKTLEFHLHGSGQPVMDWPTRLRIALGSAKGLAYLHEDCNPRIIHRDIKSANILLDDNYEAMVADFGLAKLTSDNYTHVSTRVMGTFGYLAPEYASSGKLTEKSDVFSFGVMLLELITGRRPIDLTNRNMEDSLVDWARPVIEKALEEDKYDELVDPRLEGNYNHHEMARMIASASACIRHSARRRPKMSQVIRALEGISSLEDLNEVPKQSLSTISNKGNETLAYDTGVYNAEIMKFRKMVLTSQEFNASEDGATSEYGLNPSSSSSDEFGSGQQKKKPQ